MPVVRAQRAVVAVGLVELAPRVTVVGEQHHALVQAAHHRLDPVRQLRQQLGPVAIGERRIQVAFDMADCGRQQRVGRTVGADETTLPVKRDAFLEHLTVTQREARGG